MRNHHMRFIKSLLLTQAAAVICLGADYQIVASKDVAIDEIAAADLKKVFLMEKTSAGGSKVTPVVQQGGPSHAAFLKDCLGESDQALKDHYKDLAFTGKAVAPKTVASDAAMISHIAMSKGAIGYVSSSAIPIGVKK